MDRKTLITVVVATLFAVASTANAGAIISATSAVINSGGPGSGSINDTFNQNGLSTGYTSGVTDFDSYIATNPTHTANYVGFEWFSNTGATASVTYNLGSFNTIDSIALWNEELSGIGTLNLFGSVDGSVFSALSIGLSPIDNPMGSYGVETFSFSPTSIQFVRFDMSNCPQPNSGSGNFPGCAIGEVAFRTAEVPEPGTLALFSLGLAGLGFARRRKTTV